VLCDVWWKNGLSGLDETLNHVFGVTESYGADGSFVPNRVAVIGVKSTDFLFGGLFIAVWAGVFVAY
jgi:hypothetical protein